MSISGVKGDVFTVLTVGRTSLLGIQQEAADWTGGDQEGFRGKMENGKFNKGKGLDIQIRNQFYLSVLVE